MHYRQALAVGWAVVWRALWWSLVVTLPPALVAKTIFHFVQNGSAGASALDAVLISLTILLEVFIVLPLSIREAVLDVYSDFRVSVAGRAHGGEGLTYFESLQVSLLAFAINGWLDWLLYWLHLPDRLGSFAFGLIQLPFLVLVVYPAIAAAAVRVPFYGFRVFLVPNAPHAERGPDLSH
jgi:hypothetical protein